MKKFRQGQLVKPTELITASYSQYAGRPVMEFKEGMLGVVRMFDREIGGQVEFFDPKTGLIEHCWSKQLEVIEWPAHLVDLQTNTDEVDSNYWFCGSLYFLGAIEYLKAIEILTPAYIQQLEVLNLRIPGIHSGRPAFLEAVPEVYMHQRYERLKAEIPHLLALS